jgi:hypothetical protein
MGEVQEFASGYLEALCAIAKKHPGTKDESGLTDESLIDIHDRVEQDFEGAERCFRLFLVSDHDVARLGALGTRSANDLGEVTGTNPPSFRHDCCDEFPIHPVVINAGVVFVTAGAGERDLRWLRAGSFQIATQAFQGFHESRLPRPSVSPKRQQ